MSKRTDLAVTLLAVGAACACGAPDHAPPPPAAPSPPEPSARCPDVSVADGITDRAAAIAMAAALHEVVELHETDATAPLCVTALTDLGHSFATVEVSTRLGPARVGLHVFRPRDSDGASAEPWDVGRIGPTLDELRRALDAAAWLERHPEILSATASWESDFTHVRTRSGSTICAHGLYGAPERWCWTRSPVVERLLVEGPEVVRDESSFTLTFGYVVGDRVESWAHRFPAADVVRQRDRAAPPPSPPRPAWFPGREPSLPRARAATSARTPIELVSPPDLGPLARRSPSRVGEADAIEMGWTSEAPPGYAEQAIVLCARVDDRWRCAPPRAVPHGDLGLDGHVDWIALPPGTSGERLAVSILQTMGDGGNGEFSGSTGEWRAEIYRIDEDHLAPIGSLVIGAMEWVTLRRGDFGTYYRLIARHFANVRPAGPGCIAVSERSVHYGEADGSFTTTRSRPTGTGVAVVEVPDVVQLDPWAASGPPLPVSEAPPDAIQVRAPAHDWTGVWRIEPPRLFRVSRDPTASCDLER